MTLVQTSAGIQIHCKLILKWIRFWHSFECCSTNSFLRLIKRGKKENGVDANALRHETNNNYAHRERTLMKTKIHMNEYIETWTYPIYLRFTPFRILERTSTKCEYGRESQVSIIAVMVFAWLYWCFFKTLFIHLKINGIGRQWCSSNIYMNFIWIYISIQCQYSLTSTLP